MRKTKIADARHAWPTRPMAFRAAAASSNPLTVARMRSAASYTPQLVIISTIALPLLSSVHTRTK